MLQEQVVKAVVRLGNENGHAFYLGRVEKFPVQLEVSFQGFQVLADFFNIFGVRFENGTEEERFDVLGSVLLKVNDICTGFGKNLRGAGDKALLVGTMNLQNITCDSHGSKLQNTEDVNCEKSRKEVDLTVTLD